MDSMTHRAARGAQSGDTSHESASRMSEAPPPSTNGGWKTEDVNIKQAANGGFIVRCSKTRDQPGGGDANQPVSPGGGSTYKSEELAFGSLDEAIGYIATEFGGAPAPEAPALPDMAMAEPEEGYEEMA